MLRKAWKVSVNASQGFICARDRNSGRKWTAFSSCKWCWQEQDTMPERPHAWEDPAWFLGRLLKGETPGRADWTPHIGAVAPGRRVSWDLISMLTWRMQEIRGRSRLPLKRLTCQLHQEEAKIKGEGEPSLLVTPSGKGLWPSLPRSHPVEWNPVHYFHTCQGQGQVLEIKPILKCSSLRTSLQSSG